jgi:hypothetical protein
VAVTAPAVPATGVAVPNPTGDNVNVTLAGGTTQSILVTQPNPPAVTTPAVPATTVAATNPSTFPCQVVIGANGATITAVTVNGSGVGTAAGTYVVPASGTISITYTVATPTWTWTALAGGISGNPVAANYSIDVPPGCSIVLIFTVAPTSWAWTNPDDLSYTPGYYASNTQAEAAGWNPYTALPYAQHATLGVSGLATGVSN